jgi:hypothetical protein
MSVQKVILSFIKPESHAACIEVSPKQMPASRAGQSKGTRRAEGLRVSLQYPQNMIHARAALEQLRGACGACPNGEAVREVHLSA